MIINAIKVQMQEYKHVLRTELPKIYSQDLLNNIFRHPYTKIDFVMHDLDVGRVTAAKYLDELVRINLLQKVKLGRDNYYINPPLYHLLGSVSDKKS